MRQINNMDLITGFGLILSLIPLFQREQDNREKANKEKFFTWLMEHNFAELKTQLESNFALSAEIETMLQMNQEQLLARFDEVDKKLLCIINAMPEFRSMVKMLAPGAVLTEQEESILRQFVESGALKMKALLCDQNYGIPDLRLVPSGEIRVEDPRLVSANLVRLVELDFLIYHDNHVFGLTPDAIEYVNNLKKNDLSDQAKSILKQYVESGTHYLHTTYYQGQVVIVGQNMPQNQQFVEEDLSDLEKHGFIRLHGDSGTGGKSFTLTREGDAYYQRELKKD